MPETSAGHSAIPGYEIRQLIGAGGMGEVFLAYQLSLNRPVVIEFLKSESASLVTERKLRFDREASLMADVSHPNVVTVFDRETTDGHPYLVMESIEGGSLRQRLEFGSPIPASCFPSQC